jgi:hypothetical protein
MPIRDWAHQQTSRTVKRSIQELRRRLLEQDGQHDADSRGVLALCSDLSTQRDIVLSICDKLGASHSLDTTRLIPRSVIDDDPASWARIIAAAQKVFALRSRRDASQDATMDFTGVRAGLDAILRRWADVRLKDATEGARPRTDGKQARTEYLRLYPGPFAALFVASESSD